MFYNRGEVFSDQFDHFKLILFWVPECSFCKKNITKRDKGTFSRFFGGGASLSICSRSTLSCNQPSLTRGSRLPSSTGEIQIWISWVGHCPMGNQLVVAMMLPLISDLISQSTGSQSAHLHSALIGCLSHSRHCSYVPPPSLATNRKHKVGQRWSEAVTSSLNI